MTIFNLGTRNPGSESHCGASCHAIIQLQVELIRWHFIREPTGIGTSQYRVDQTVYHTKVMCPLVMPEDERIRLPPSLAYIWTGRRSVDRLGPPPPVFKAVNNITARRIAGSFIRLLHMRLTLSARRLSQFFRKVKQKRVTERSFQTKRVDGSGVAHPLFEIRTSSTTDKSWSKANWPPTPPNPSA